VKKEDILNLINENPIFHLATVEGDQPRVRAMLIYRADEDGIVFHTGSMRDVYRQIEANPKVELCFNDDRRGVQVRVWGKLEQVTDSTFKDEIYHHPSRAFLRPWRETITLHDFHKQFIVYVLRKGSAVWWTMARNFAPKEPITL
jgi:pyridoxamine 5'-phosphate oxidase